MCMQPFKDNKENKDKLFLKFYRLFIKILVIGIKLKKKFLKFVKCFFLLYLKILKNFITEFKIL